jgi:hypothetical protein
MFYKIPTQDYVKLTFYIYRFQLCNISNQQLIVS